MEPGAYAEPMLRPTWIHSTMVSGYVSSRLRIADPMFGTNFCGTNLEDNLVDLLVEHVGTGTQIYFQVNQTLDTSPAYTRTAITPQYLVNVAGKRRVTFTVNEPIIEIKCVGGAGKIRAQVESRLKWEHMAFDRTDPAGAPALWNKKYSGPGSLAPAPFPTT